MIKVRELFRDTDSTEFVIVTIPAVICQKIFLNTRYAYFFNEHLPCRLKGLFAGLM
jgi:arsenite-transporting ATPase